MQSNKTTRSISKSHRNGMIRVSMLVSILQITGMLFEYSTFFALYPLPQKIMQSVFLSIIFVSFIVFLFNKTKLYKQNFVLLSYTALFSIVFSIILFPEFYSNIHISRDLFFMRNMLFLFAYIGFVGLIADKKHIWIQGFLTLIYITFMKIISNDPFILNSIPLYYLVTIGFCAIMTNTISSIEKYINGLGDINNLNDYLQKTNFHKRRRLEYYNKAIIQLSNIKVENYNDQHENNASLNYIVSFISNTLKNSRTSIWLLSSDKKSLKKEVMVDEGQIDTSVMYLESKDYPRYFHALLTKPCVAASDALTDEDTIEFSENYLIPMSIYSMLDCPIKINGEVIGVVCCEQKREKKEWMQEDILFIQSISDYIALHLKNSESKTLLKALEQKNTEILDSIKYAKRLQYAILPSARKLEKYLANSFVLYKPKDIVAGDFYWLEEVNDHIIFAVGDCTGHGVPGAMVSVVCHNALNRAVKDYCLLDPGEILNKTRELVIEQFENSEDYIRDGMDISLAVYNSKEKTLLWAGANSPLLIHRESGIIKLIPNKQPIGNYVNIQPFTTISVNLQKGDLIYMYTDGFVDQFGGSEAKKLKFKRFLSLIEKYHTEKLIHQKTLFEEAFTEWKGSMEQIDDVCLLGISFD